MGFMKEFKDFAMRGNVMDMAVGIVIGGAFGKIVSSFVADVIMPPLGLLLGKVNFTDLVLTLKEAVPAVVENGQELEPAVAAVTLNYGQFVQTAVDFIIIAFAIFLVVKAMNALKRKEEAAPPPPPPAPPEASKEELLLTEIRDLLKK
ncbi:MAG: large-conductance mechanosensitive channel protein MscL [Lentisphaeria bacterium]|nr:large-conductance mechanosensitive channel protein MscL [Lentisphaeria bacterium]MDY0177268.1 large-conductance mechanosensitive channel protein MscL [Lentisphaeria bacterium]NLZ61006.1 large-conductance mechanosensitive channel protein MscL [Lentisphaerota bacterium]